MTLTDREKAVVHLHYYKQIILGQMDRSHWAAVREELLVAVMRKLI